MSRTLPVNAKLDKRFFLLGDGVSLQVTSFRTRTLQTCFTICDSHRPPLQGRECSGATSCWHFFVSSPLLELVSFIFSTGSSGSLSELSCLLEKAFPRHGLPQPAPMLLAPARA